MGRRGCRRHPHARRPPAVAAGAVLAAVLLFAGQQAKAEAEAWVQDIRVGKKPWGNAAVAQDWNEF